MEIIYSVLLNENDSVIVTLTSYFFLCMKLVMFCFYDISSILKRCKLGSYFDIDSLNISLRL